jgi:hypothetical protein
MGSISDRATGIFHSLDPSGRTIALGSNRNEYQGISWR